MQISPRKTWGQQWDILFRCIGEEIWKSKVMVLGGEEGLEWKVCVDGMQLDHVLEFKNVGYVLDKSGTDGAECNKKVAMGGR